MELDDYQIELGQGGELALALILAVMIFAVALGLRVSQFRDIARAPGPFAAGAVAQLLALPLITLALCYTVQPVPSVALGMIIVACCPGGASSNLICLFARGNTALSVSLTATSSLAAALATPVSILFWTSLYAPTANLLDEINLSIPDFLIQTAIILGIPILLGMIIAAKLPRLAARLQTPAAILGGGGLALLVAVSLIGGWGVFLQLGVALLGLVVIQNTAAFLTGNLIARGVGASRADRRTLTIETGIQNSGLGIVILLTQMEGLGGAAAVVGIWGVWHLIAGVGYALIVRYGDRRRVRGSEPLAEI